MGATYVDVTIRNPSDRQRSWTGRFLVDTGAFDSMAPRSCLESIGLEPIGTREYELADGGIVAMDIALGQIELRGHPVGGIVAFGDDDAEPLLGVTALDSGGFAVDPRSQELIRRPAVAMKSACSPHRLEYLQPNQY